MNTALLSGNSDLLFFFFGVWQLEIAQLHITQVNQLSQSLHYFPIVSYDEALLYFQKAIHRNPKRNVYYYFSAKCAYQQGDLNTTKFYLHKGTLIPAQYPEDIESVNFMNQLKKII